MRTALFIFLLSLCMQAYAQSYAPDSDIAQWCGNDSNCYRKYEAGLHAARKDLRDSGIISLSTGTRAPDMPLYGNTPEYLLLTRYHIRSVLVDHEVGAYELGYEHVMDSAIGRQYGKGFWDKLSQEVRALDHAGLGWISPTMKKYRSARQFVAAHLKPAFDDPRNGQPHTLLLAVRIDSTGRAVSYDGFPNRTGMDPAERAEADRLFKLLPRFKPAKFNGRPVASTYFLHVPFYGDAKKRKDKT